MMLVSPLSHGRLDGLDGKTFDVAVIGGGINGSATADTLSAAGYDVLLVERRDFGSGSSSRSSRMMHCGLNYLAMAKDAPSLKRKVGNFLLARNMMRERDRLTRVLPDRMTFKTLHIPLRNGDAVKPWQFDVAFALLKALGGYSTPLNYRRVPQRDLPSHPLTGYFGPNLIGIASYSEAVFDWPERVCVDYALKAAGNGATVLNYTALTGVEKQGPVWRLGLATSLHPAGKATVGARALVNMAGVWSDQINRLRAGDTEPTVRPNRGCHLAVRLPDELRGIGIVERNALGHLLMCLPWQDFHIVGPSETPLADIDLPLQATGEDVDMLLMQADAVIPGAHLGAGDVLFRWAGMRPAAHEPGNPLGSWERKVHVSPRDAGPAWVSIAWGRLADHAFTARDILAAVSGRLGAPCRMARSVSSRLDTTAPKPLRDLDSIVATEAPASVADVMFGRTGLGWQADQGLGQAPEVAAALARMPGAGSAGQLLADYRAYLEAAFSRSDAAARTD